MSFFENLGILFGLVPFKFIEKYFSFDCISPDNSILSINVVSAIKILCLILKEVRMEILFSSTILLMLKPFNKLSITLLHTQRKVYYNKLLY